MSNWKIDPHKLKYEYSFVDVVRLREYLNIKQVKEEAFERDSKLKEGK